MHPPCPTCNTELTPSIVGYLCHNCGETHSFEKLASSGSHTQTKHSGHARSSKNPSKSKNTTQPNQPIQSSQTIQNKTNVMPPVVQQRKGIKHHIKGFVVPTIASLPKPIDESHLLESHYTDIDQELTQTPLGMPTEAATSLATTAEPKLKEPETTRAVTHDAPAESVKQQSASGVQTSSSDKTLLPAIIVASMLIIVSLIILFVI